MLRARPSVAPAVGIAVLLALVPVLVPRNITLLNLGFHGFLIGETLMRASDPEKALRDLISRRDVLAK